MKQAAFKPLRESLLRQATGTVLEIGFGTGVNLPYYPGAIGSVMAIDSNPWMIPFARSYSSNGKHLVRWSIASAEQLPFPNNVFETVLSTLTLCSVPQISLAIQELYRVLKPGGQFLFLEHGQSPDRLVCRWQNWLTPFWKHVGDGCHLNRPMAELIRVESWDLTTMKTYYLPKVPKPFAYFYQGCAVKTQ